MPSSHTTCLGIHFPTPVLSSSFQIYGLFVLHNWYIYNLHNWSFCSFHTPVKVFFQRFNSLFPPFLSVDQTVLGGIVPLPLPTCPMLWPAPHSTMVSGVHGSWIVPFDHPVLHYVMVAYHPSRWVPVYRICHTLGLDCLAKPNILSFYYPCNFSEYFGIGPCCLDRFQAIIYMWTYL